MKLIFEKSVPGRRCSILPRCDVEEVQLPQELRRQEAPALPELSEVDLSRHYTELCQHVHGVNCGFYPLGSCTMKYNPRIDEEMAALPGFAGVHPLAPEHAVAGCREVLDTASRYLCQITGMDGMTFQPAAGAHGEFTGVLLIKQYHDARGDHQRTKIIVPDSAHGTNPATAAMCGYQVVNIPSAADGCVDLEALKAVMGDDVAGLMLTNPNTVGIFDENILEITHALPRTVFLREGRPVLRPGPFGVAAEGFAHQAPFQRPPAARGIGPVILEHGPEIHLRTGEAEQFPDLRLHGPAGQEELAEADKAFPDVAVGEELLKEVERRAVLSAFAEAVAQPDGVRKGALRSREVEKHPVDAVGPAFGGHQRVVQLFPVARAEPPVLGGVHIDVGEVGHDARGRYAFGQDGPGEPRARKAAAHDPQPRGETHQRLHRGGQTVIVRLELGFQALGSGFLRPVGVLHGECAARILAETGEHVPHPRVGPGGRVDAQVGDALFVHELFEGPELQSRKKVVRHLGMFFHQRGAPPH